MSPTVLALSTDSLNCTATTAPQLAKAARTATSSDGASGEYSADQGSPEPFDGP